MNKAKIFMNGQSQAVRLPKKFKFDAKEVSIVQLGKGLVLQPVLKTWREVFNEIKPTDDFFPEGRKDLPLQERNWELFK